MAVRRRTTKSKQAPAPKPSPPASAAVAETVLAAPLRKRTEQEREEMVDGIGMATDATVITVKEHHFASSAFKCEYCEATATGRIVTLSDREDGMRYARERDVCEAHRAGGDEQ